MATTQVWRRLSHDMKNEVQSFCLNCQFPGPREKMQPVITFDGAPTLMNWLPGENAKKWRGKNIQMVASAFTLQRVAQTT